MNLPGLHHVTAITGDVKRNVAFYTGVLGLRLVKVTVNYDDPASYHLYYGDRLGTPGTLLTFFGWPDAPRARGGTGQTAATAYAVDPASVGYWQERLAARDVDVQPADRFGDQALSFVDPDGMALEIVGTGESDASKVWSESEVPGEHALRGFHSVTLRQADRAKTESLLTEHLGFERVEADGHRARFRAAGGSSASLVDVVEESATPRGRDGVGQVHHVAFRTIDEASQRQWQQTIATLGFHVSPVMDRDYFRSIYFRESGGVLFEIATDGPGMTVNEPAESLGTRLMLPRNVERYRAELEKVLPPLF